MDKFYIIQSLRDKIPANSVYLLDKALDSATDEQMRHLSLLNIKNPIITLLFSIFLGSLGIDRFYIKDTKLGAIKLTLGILGYILTFVALGVALASPELAVILSAIGGLILSAVGIWAFVDIFLCFSLTKKKNLSMIMQVLSHRNNTTTVAKPVNTNNNNNNPFGEF